MRRRTKLRPARVATANARHVRNAAHCLITLGLCCLSLLPPRLAAAGIFDNNGQCVGDANGDGAVTVNELVQAVTNVLQGCDLQPVTLQFRAQVGDQPFSCGTEYHNIGTTNGDIVPSDFRFYVHNIRLVTPQGLEVPLRLDQDGVWQYQDLALLDFENKMPPCGQGTAEMNTALHGMVPPGTYTGLRFYLGVPFNLDHLDESTAPSPLNLSGLFWSWQDGYKFLRIDTAFDNLRVHLGSTGCVFGSRINMVESCSHTNVGEVNFDHFDAATNVIVADLAALLSDSDINSNQPNTAPGCQSDLDDLDCVPMFKNLGVNWNDGSRNPTSQKFFRVE